MRRMIELFVEERIGALKFWMLSHEQKSWRVQFQPMRAAKAATSHRVLESRDHWERSRLKVIN